ncbi:receptor-type tyrosine-protein phosphatase H-like isoform X4 [Hoplias malabaricus]|uniref:receptor-type tyrosine-protein phosphatase H-like isoform X4 n=1 Tax=Hoplias malabaricus TaxID=27720 RepID=UPI003462BF23
MRTVVMVLLGFFADAIRGQTALALPVSVLRVNVTELYENQLRLSWEKVTGNNISYILRENKMETLILEPDQGSSVNYTVTSHSPGSKYTFTLYTLFEGVRSRGLNFSFVTASVMVTGLRCEQVSSGSALLLVWNAPLGIWREVEVQVHVKGRSPQYTNGTRLEVCDLQPARWYNVSLKLCSGDVRSIPVSVTCQTDPRGVIAGAALAALFIVTLVCVGIYVKYRQAISRRKTHRDTLPQL